MGVSCMNELLQVQHNNMIIYLAWTLKKRKYIRNYCALVFTEKKKYSSKDFCIVHKENESIHLYFFRWNISLSGLTLQWNFNNVTLLTVIAPRKREGREDSLTETISTTQLFPISAPRQFNYTEEEWFICKHAD